MSSRFRCVRCNRLIEAGEFYVEVQQAYDRDGKIIVIRGVSELLAHLDCPTDD